MVNENEKQREENKPETEKEEGTGIAQAKSETATETVIGDPPEKAEEAPRPAEKKSEEEEPESMEDFGELFEKSLKERDFEEGQIVKGTVVGVTKEHVMVDIGGKSEGHVPIQEFLDDAGEPTVDVGDEIEVLLERRDEEDGIIRLSKDKAEKRRIWDDLDEAHRDEKSVKGKIVEKVKGGLMVDIGVMAFLPSSQSDVRPVRNLDKLLGIEDDFQIIKFNRKRGNVVVSRRAVLEKEMESKREETLTNLEKDLVVAGVVKNLTEYGAFVDLGGIDGLLHITDMSYGRINHPSEIMNVGDEINVKILRFNRETEKVSLGLKQILPDPWDNVEKKYPVGTIVIGKAVSVTDYGAFVELEKGVEGLVHVSEMSWAKKRVHPSKLVEPDQEVEAKVLDIDMVNRRISLSIKQAQPNPWDELELTYPVGTKIKGMVRNITNFGAFIGVEEGVDGLVHISDLSWTKRIKHPSEVLKKGEEVEAVVLKIDKENERFSLGVKQAQPDPWETVRINYQPGQDVLGKVVNITDFGVFVELEEGIEGLIHISELSHDKVKDPTEMVQVGQEISAEILNVDINERKIRLSVKALERTEDEAAYKQFRKAEGDGTSKLGELIQDKLSSIKTSDTEEGAKEEDAAAPEPEKEEQAEQAASEPAEAETTEEEPEEAQEPAAAETSETEEAAEPEKEETTEEAAEPAKEEATEETDEPEKEEATEEAAEPEKEEASEEADESTDTEESSEEEKPE